MSSIVRSFLLGSAYIFRHKQMQHEHRKHLSARTDKVISRAKKQWASDSDHGHFQALSASTTSSALSESPTSPGGANMPLSPGGTSRRHVVNHSDSEIRDALHVARHDHMSDADCFVSAPHESAAVITDFALLLRTARAYEPHESILRKRNRQTHRERRLWSMRQTVRKCVGSTASWRSLVRWWMGGCWMSVRSKHRGIGRGRLLSSSLLDLDHCGRRLG
jgi:hypothetical protein